MGFAHEGNYKVEMMKKMKRKAGGGGGEDKTQAPVS